MPSERIYLRMRCNQACVYCNSRWDTDNAAYVGPNAIASRVTEAVASGADEVILTGGEPTLLPGLEGVVSFLKSQGIPKIVLETNATQLGENDANVLAEAGLSVARVNLSGWGEDLDRVTQDPGGFKRTLAGIDALIAAGVRIQLAGILSRSTVNLLPSVPKRLAETLGDLSSILGLWISVPTDTPDPEETLSLEESAKGLMALDRAARSVGLRLQLNPEGPLRPCMLVPTSRYAHLFSMTPGGRHFDGVSHIETCDQCLVKDRCVGLHNGTLERFGAPQLVPITSERMRRRLSLRSSMEEQIESEYLTRDRRRGTDGVTLTDYIVRVNFSCNQACRFCFVSTHLPGAQDLKIRAAIAEAGRANARITFSGGEPCLNPKLVEYIELARSQTESAIELQTNATRLGDKKLSQRIVEAGVNEVFISLHASHAELSDRITDAPGTFEQTVAGIDAIASVAPKTTLHFVICQDNVADLRPWVSWVGARWPGVSINFSFVGFISDVVPRDEEMLPRYSDVLPTLEAALVDAQELHLNVGRFHSMCGIPLCLAPDVTKSYMTLSDVDESLAGNEFVKPTPCDACGLRSKCFGIRRGYAAIYGTDELSPFP
jgi:MoaA/NifB/PqqE/SkfB family radical SAM enzyme